MSEQYYRLEDSWWSSDWPYEIDPSALKMLNEVSPQGYHYSLCESPDGTRIDLYEYADEMEGDADD